MTNGIYTLANDVVLDQLIALLNSIEVNGGNIPVSVIAYDDRIEGVKAEIENRGNPNITFFNDRDVMAKWDCFSRSAWDTHPTAVQDWSRSGSRSYHRFGTHRRYCAFNGEFKNFIYMDADTLLMSPVDVIFDKIEDYDCVTYDFQYKDPSHVYNMNALDFETIFTSESISNKIFCSGFYGSKKDLFTTEKMEKIIAALSLGEARILYPMAPDQTLLNYMMMRSDCSIYNLALNLPVEDITGCCVTSPHFEDRDHILYDKNKRLTYIHYIGLSSRLFSQLCAGVNLDFPYRDLFLHYRFLKNPEQRPQFSDRPQAWNVPPNFWQKLNRKLSGLLKKV